MRGLTNEERATLERWARGEYSRNVPPGALLLQVDPVAAALFRDHRGYMRLSSEPGVYNEAYPTAAGFLALKLDALARATVPA